MTKEELKKEITSNGGYMPNTDAVNTANEYANDYDWDNEWESFDPIEACRDAFLAGIQYAISRLD